MKRENLVEAVSKELLRMISVGEFKAGEQLPPHEALAETFGVSRSTIREATQALRMLGLIETSPGRGSRVCLDPQQRLYFAKNATTRVTGLDASKIYEARHAFERTTVSLAAVRAGSDDISRIQAAYTRLVKSAGDAEEFALADLEFHSAVASASHNELLAQFYELNRDLLLSAPLVDTYLLPGVPENAFKTHEGIMRGIIARDPRAALEAFDDMQRYSEQLLCALYPDGSDAHRADGAMEEGGEQLSKAKRGKK